MQLAKRQGSWHPARGHPALIRMQAGPKHQVTLVSEPQSECRYLRQSRCCEKIRTRVIIKSGYPPGLQVDRAVV